MEDDMPLARRLRFHSARGNWIAPDGNLIIAETDNEQHTDTLAKFLHTFPPQNDLAWKNQFIEFGGKETPPTMIAESEGFQKHLLACPLWVGRNCCTLLH